MSKIKPEFCESNFADLFINDTFTLTATPAINWYQDKLHYLYDHRNDRILKTKDADDDTVTVYLELDMQDDVFVDTIKILNTNIKNCVIEIKKDGGASYTTLFTVTSNTKSSIHLHGGLPGFTYLRAENGLILLTEDGKRILLDSDNYGRYLKLTITATQTPDAEKFIGELYIGRRSMIIEEGTVLNYNLGLNDTESQIISDINGVGTQLRRKSNYLGQFQIKNMNQTEYNFVLDLVNKGGIYDFFPTSDVEASDKSISIDDIYYVSATATWDTKPWGRSPASLVDIRLIESKVARIS